MTSARGIALTALFSWFIYWGHGVFLAFEERQAAEQSWFEADARQDWSAAEGYRRQARDHTETVAADVAWGLGLPMLWLAGLELRRVRDRRQRRIDSSLL